LPTPSPISLTRQQIRRLDQLAIEELGIPGLILMENAGRNVAAAAMVMLAESMAAPGVSRQHPTAPRKVAILCGGGNNGGDGFVAARHLHNHGIATTVLLAKDPARITGDAAVNLNIVRRMGLDVRPVLDAAQLQEQSRHWSTCTLIIDALLGTGFTGTVEPHLAAVIQACNRAHQMGVPVLAVDLPSGLDCDTGKPSNATIVATRTVTLAALKVGLTRPAALPYVGQLEVADIGAPPSLLLRALQEPAA
jgi:hydroxyethylthiazole kinase-like uncharacterized protein yjeF